MKALPKQTELVKFNNGEFDGHWFARVKNTENGWRWINNFRQKNRKLKVTLYGRSPNRRSRCVNSKSRYYANYHKPSIAETIVVYIDKKPRRNKDIKVSERIDFNNRGYHQSFQVRKVWYDNGTKFLTADSYSFGERIFAKWSDKRQMWIELK